MKKRTAQTKTTGYQTENIPFSTKLSQWDPKARTDHENIIG